MRDPGIPKRISIETARKWMHELEFNVVAEKKGTFVDVHERQDVVEYRKMFLQRVVAGLGILTHYTLS